MFASKYISFPEATRLIKIQQQLPDDAQNPLLDALREGALFAEITGEGGWIKVAADWWNKPPVAWPNPYQQNSKKQLGVNPHEVRVERAKFEALWPTEPQRKAVNTGGRQPKWNWEAAMIELARIAVHDDDPTRGTMTKKITEWFAERNGGEAPVPSQIRDKVRIFHEAIWPPRT